MCRFITTTAMDMHVSDSISYLYIKNNLPMLIGPLLESLEVMPWAG